MIKEFLQRAGARFATRFCRREVNNQIYTVSRNWSWTEQSILNLRELGFRPTTVLDIGAASGEFYKTTRKIFKDSRVILFEARKDQADKLKLLVEQDSLAQVYCEVLGAEQLQEVTFYSQGVGSSVYKNLRKEDHGVPEQRFTTKLDMCLGEEELGDRIFLKADVQGFELEILKGSKETLKNTEVMLLECSLVQLNEGCPLLTDTVEFAADLGFVPYDICSFFRGGPHGRLRQIDMVFLKGTSNLQSYL